MSLCHYVIMSLFDLPFDIREKIWRRARFESARDSVKNKLDNRTQVVEFYISSIEYTVKVYLRINESKTISIENVLHADMFENVIEDFMVVSVSDTTRVHVHFSCTSDDNRVRVCLLTNFLTRHYIYRKHNIDHAQKISHTISKWYPNTCHMDAMSSGTTIRIFKYEW